MRGSILPGVFFATIHALRYGGKICIFLGAKKTVFFGIYHRVTWILKIAPCIVCLLFLIISHAHGVTVGSNSAVARQALTTFPAIDSNNKMLGFGRFTNGFTLEDSTTSCTFDSIFPVSGVINLRGGKLWLTQDMVLSDTYSLNSLGEIWGNGNTLTLRGNAGPLVLSKIPQKKVYTGMSFILASAQYHEVWGLSWSYDDQYLAVATKSTGSGGEVRIFQFNGTTLTEMASIETNADVWSVDWHPTSYDLAVVSKDIQNQANKDVAVYRFNPGSSTVTFISGIDEGKTGFSVAWHPSGSYLAAGYKEKLLVVYSYLGSSLSSVASATTLLEFEECALSWSPDGTYICAGMGQTSGGKNDVLIYKFTGSSLIDKGGIELGERSSSVHWMETSAGSFIAEGLQSGSNRLRVLKFNKTTETLTDQGSAYDGGSASVFAVRWSPNNSLLAQGLDNAASLEIKVYEFDDVGVTFNSLFSFTHREDIFVVRWSNSQSYLACGTKDDSVRIYGLSELVTTNLFFSDTKLVLNTDIILKTPIFFRNNCIINGNGHKIIFSDDNEIIVRRGAQLTLEDVQLWNLNASNLQCLHDDAGITFKNCDLNFSRDFTFSTGSLRFESDVHMSGTVLFNYTSNQVSTIASLATLFVEPGMTFKYAPNLASKNLLTMTDATSSLWLDGSTLYCTTTGLRLSTGSVYFDHKVTLSSEAQNMAQAMEFAPNLSLNFLGGAFLNVFGRVNVV